VYQQQVAERLLVRALRILEEHVLAKGSGQVPTDPLHALALTFEHCLKTWM
jgi:hypothetical protein